MARWLKNDFKPGSKVPHDWLNTIANFWNGLTITESNIVGIKRQSDGRFTEILIGTGNDTEGYNVSLNPDGRQTIEQNPEDYTGDAASHSKERQLRNVQHVRRGSYSVPFFVSEVTLQGAVPDKVVGDLYWAQPDAGRYDDDTALVYRSIDIENTYSDTSKGKWNLEVYGFSGSSQSMVPYSTDLTTVGGTGKEITWRYPVGIAGDPQNIAPGTSIAFVTGLTAGSPPGSGSYAAIDFTATTGTVLKGAIDYNAGTSGTAYVPVTFDFDDITPNIEHNYISGAVTLPEPAWTASNNGHDGRYLRIGADWFGDTYNNTCAGIANDATGARAIDFASGYLIGDTFSEGATVDYGARKLYCYEGAAHVETADWQDRKLSAATIASPWKAVGAFRVTVLGDATKWIDFIAENPGSLVIKNQAGTELARFDP